METRGSRRTYTPRRWPLRLMAAVFVVSFVALLGWAYHRQHAPTYAALPEPQLRQAPAAQQVIAARPGQTPSSTAAAIAPSPATQVYIPNADHDRVISTPVQPLDGCQRIIDPPHSGPDFGGVFGCSDLAQPGTSSPSLTVLAGHSSQDVDTAFNRLYVQGEDLVGQEVFVRTRASGERWLVYRINAVHAPSKTALPYLADVWGKPGTSTAGRLLLVTCRQQPDVRPAVQNYVAVAQLVGVR